MSAVSCVACFPGAASTRKARLCTHLKTGEYGATSPDDGTKPLRGHQNNEPKPVALFHYAVAVVQRSKGESAVAGAAYRSGESLIDERTGEVHDYTKRGGIVAPSEIVAPEGAPDWVFDRANCGTAQRRPSGNGTRSRPGRLR